MNNKGAQPMLQRTYFLVLLLGCSTMGMTCGPGKSNVAPANVSTLLENAAQIEDKEPKAGFEFSVENGSAPKGPSQDNKAVEGTPLSNKERDRLLSRMSVLKEDGKDQKPFAIRAKSLPPPRTGKTIKATFPPEELRAVPTGENTTSNTSGLKVLRVQPTGDVNIAPKITINFSKPMVALSSHEQTIADGVPVRMTPEVAGTWRWAGTRTLIFEAKPRLPMATEYQLEIPAGTQSATGEKLKEAKNWSFKTPAVQLSHHAPGSGESIGLRPMIRLSFDQAIDPAHVLGQTTLKDSRNDSVGLRLTRPEELKKAKITVEKNDNGEVRTVYLQTKTQLDPNSHYTVNIAKGLSSKEGPRKTEAVQNFAFRTYRPFRFHKSYCGSCTAHSTFSLRFNNSIDRDAFEDSMVQISPKVEEVNFQVSGRYLYIRGWFNSGTTYTVQVSKKLKDFYGQNLNSKAEASFTVKAEPPQMFFEGGNFRVLDPVGAKEAVVNTLNIKSFEVSLYSISPDDFEKIPQANEVWRPQFPGKLISKRTVQVKGKQDEFTKTSIKLDGALNSDGFGNAVLFVRQINPPLTHDRYVHGQQIQWNQITGMAVDATTDGNKVHAWVTRLSDGKPISGAKVIATFDGQSATTNEQGLAILDARDLSSTNRRRGRYHHSWRRNTTLHIKKGTDESFYPDAINYARTIPPKRSIWYSVSDRGLYRPKEDVAIKGWIRNVDFNTGGGINGAPAKGSKVSYVIRDSRRNKLKSGKITLSALGGFDFQFKLPPNMNLGRASIEMRLNDRSKMSLKGRTHTLNIRVEEFRRPEFEVNAKSTEGPHIVGGKASLTVEAKYYAGGPLNDAGASWTIRSRVGHFTPPNQHEYTFGQWTPWWRSYSSPSKEQFQQNLDLKATTDGAGKHHALLHFKSVHPPKPISIRAEATVIDINRRRMSANTGLLVHPSKLYVGMKTKTYFVEQNKPLAVDLVASNIAGELVSDVDIHMTAHRVENQWVKGQMKTEEKDEQKCTVRSQKEAVQCVFKTTKGGRYILRASLHDEEGRPNQSEMSRWVSGASDASRSARVEREELQLIPSKRSVKPGESAEILVQSPFFPASGIMRIQRGGVERVEHFTMESATTVLRIPITKKHIPNLAVHIEIAGQADRINVQGDPDKTLPPRPALAGGTLNFRVPTEVHKINVEASPLHKSVAPGGETEISIKLSDSEGKPIANAEAVLLVVDESVLALSNHSHATPLTAFFPTRSTHLTRAYFRPMVWLPDPATLLSQLSPGQPKGMGFAEKETEDSMYEFEESGSIGGLGSMDSVPMPSARSAKVKRKQSAKMGLGMRGTGSGGGGGAGLSPPMIAVRTNFNPLAAFVPNLKTNSNGEVKAKVKLPDNLTRYRIVVLTVAGTDLFGKGESKLTARLPLMVRPSAPRFLNYGDTFEFPVVVQNQTDQAQTVSVAIRGTNIKFTGTRGRRIEIPANSRAEVRFPAAAQEAGTARFQIAASADGWADGAELSIPVWTPATTEAFATYGVIDDGAATQPVKMPGKVIPNFGGLEISTSSTQLQALTDAVLYLTTYRFECSEQLSSKILSIAALRDVLSAFKAKGLPSKKKLLASIKSSTRKLAKMQNRDGGFGFWRRDGESWPFLSIHVAHALTRAKSKGFTIPHALLSNLMTYVKDIKSNIPADYSVSIKRVIRAYALYVRAHAGDIGTLEAKALVKEAGGIDALPLESMAWLYPVFVKSDDADGELKAIRSRLNNLISETAATAHFTTSYQDGGHLILHSSRRIDGLLLEGLILDQPESDLIPKIVRGLLAHRTRGRWGNTQENAWVLLGLDLYFNTYEKVTPNFVARAWLGEQFAGEHRFKGRTKERHQINIPMKYVAAAEKTDLVLSKDGKGRMYYRIGMNYAPSDLMIPPADHGFAVERSYEGLDDPQDVRRDEDGTWHIKAGARVKVKVTMVAESRRYHVALVDPLPAGLEPVTPGLVGNQSIQPKVKPQQRNRRRGRGYYRSYRRGPWYRHQNMRDERVEAFTPLLRAGVYTYSYSALATTPGHFVVPPAKAEEMYFPETFGRSAGDKVIVN